MNAFTIKDLENLSGIKAHTIRIWEQRYSFLRPQRTTTNIRYYTNEELKTVLNIALLNKYGYKISHIDKMSSLEVREKIVSLSHIEAQQERLVNDLLQFMIDLDLEQFEDLLDNYIMAKGIDKTISFLIFPFLDKIGILWQASHIHPAQEHVVTNIIRQKLIVGIESVVSHISVNKKVILFLPEGEYVVDVYTDGKNAIKEPNELIHQIRTVTKNDTMTIWLAGGGGAVMHVRKK